MKGAAAGRFAVVGELALDGQIQPVRGILAVGLVAGGVILALLGASRYIAAAHRIETATHRPSTGAILIGAAMVVAVGALSAAFILLLHR